jgi:hypothetical protein
MENEALGAYTDLIKAFLINAIDAQQFESGFLEKFKNDSAEFPDDVFQLLDEMFGAVDAFCADPELRDEHDLTEKQLRSKAAEILAKLSSK